jgi:hypothetical protein
LAPRRESIETWPGVAAHLVELGTDLAAELMDADLEDELVRGGFRRRTRARRRAAAVHGWYQLGLSFTLAALAGGVSVLELHEAIRTGLRG